MLNITVAGTALSSYYLDDPALFLREQRDHVGADTAAEGIAHARAELRRLVADIDETSPLGGTRSRVLTWLSHFGWRFTAAPQSLEEALIGRDDAEESRGWVLVTPPGRLLDAAPSGRRAGKLRPQRQAETCVRSGQPPLPAVLLCNGSELRIIRRDPGLGGEATYLAIDLAGLAELGDEHEWRVAWALLRPEAFDPGPSGESLWQRTERASAEAAETVSEDLSDGVRTAIRALSDGALQDMRHRGEPTPESRALFADALKIAYRLLFVAYAEDRGLLPAGTPAYDSGYSLGALRKAVEDPATLWQPDGAYLWHTLRAQWALFRDGMTAGELAVAGFNGGLFDPGQCPLFDTETRAVGDSYIRTVISALSWTQPRASRSNPRETVARRRVNYRELGVEQLGSIYEGLLAFEPHIAAEPKVLVQRGRGQQVRQQIVSPDEIPADAETVEEYPPGSFYLFEATGQRKGSGSYYTPKQLAHFVVGEALGPLTSEAEPEDILRLRVCDPAMGSGAFLVPAVHFLTQAYGEALARAGTDIDHELNDEERARYRRLIVERCIYGVDYNPMAVELAKVSLWLTTASAGKPLSFLDAHLRCGNSIVGAQMDTWEGVPAPARPSGRKATEAGGSSETEQESLFDVDTPDLTKIIRARRRLAESPSEDRIDVRDKEQRFARLLGDAEWNALRALGDWWVAPYFHSGLHRDAESWRAARRGITEELHDQPSLEHARLADDRATYLGRLREEIRPFHWEIEFPEIFFDERGEWRKDAGFDAMIGNPPWEGITFKDAEFFGRFDPAYTLLKSKPEKQQRRRELLQRDDVVQAREEVDTRLDGIKLFIKNSGHYRMLYWHGTTFNYYRTFLEREMSLLAPAGRLGLVIDSGVTADAATAEHRRELLQCYTIDHFVLCDNTEGIFPIHRSEQFLLLVAGREKSTETLPFTSGVTKLDHLLDLESRTLPITRTTLEALAPDTLAVPDIRDPDFLEIFSILYQDRPLFLQKMPIGGWSVDWGRELDLHDDAGHLEPAGSGILIREGKHTHQFYPDYESPAYQLKSQRGMGALHDRARKRAKKRPEQVQSFSLPEGEQGLYDAEPRKRVLELPSHHYRPCFREVARASDERTLIACVLPPGNAVTHSLHFFYRSTFDPATDGYHTILPARAMVYVVALLNSLVLDFVVRRKVSAHVTKSVMATLPVADVSLDRGQGKAVVDLSARLTCRSAEFEELAEVLGAECGPLAKEEERALRAELDARIAHLYGLDAGHLELVLGDFKPSEGGDAGLVRPDEDYKQRVREEFARLVGE